MKRIFFIGVVLLLVSIWGCKNNETIQPLTKTQKEAINYLPAESQFVMFANLNELHKTGFWNNYFKSALLKNYIDNKSYQKFKEETGVGLEGGISQILIAHSKNLDNVTIAVFNKNLSKIKSYFNKYDNFSKELINNNSVYTLKERYPVQVFFINDSTIIAVNNINFIKSIIEKKNTPLKNNKSLFGIIRNIKNKNQYWIATDKGTYAVNYIRKILGVNENTHVNKILKSVESVTLAAQFGDGIDIESNWNCNDSKNAYLLSTAIKGALALDILSGDDHSIGKILRKTEIERSKSQINFQLELKGKDINTLKDFAEKKDLERKL